MQTADKQEKDQQKWTDRQINRQMADRHALRGRGGRERRASRKTNRQNVDTRQRGRGEKRKNADIGQIERQCGRLADRQTTKGRDEKRKTQCRHRTDRKVKMNQAGRQTKVRMQTEMERERQNADIGQTERQ